MLARTVRRSAMLQDEFERKSDEEINNKEKLKVEMIRKIKVDNEDAGIVIATVSSSENSEVKVMCNVTV